MSEALHDQLTGLMTPFYFYESAKQLRFWADRKGQPLALISIRASGLSDEELASCSRALLNELRGGDLLCRMGERNLVLLLVGDKESAGHLIFRLENVIKPRLKYEAIGLEIGRSLIEALEELGV